MKAAIVTVGDEILIGQITDTNSGIIAKMLDKIGISIIEMISITDSKEHILKTLNNYQNKVDLVVITGGLGPTKDDITKKTIAEYFNDTLIYNESVLEHVTQLIENLFKKQITQLNKDQALVPSKATVLFNPVGTAPGMWLQKENTTFISLPGVPYEMKNILENEVIPKIVATYKRPFIHHKTLLTYGVGESVIAERIENWENALPINIKLAYLPSPGRVRLRLTAKGNNEQELVNAVNFQFEKLKPQLTDCLVGFEETETVEVVIGNLLKATNKTIAVAESCTGGKIASKITAVPGASQYFKGGIIPYETKTKNSILGIPNNIIKEHSVVSFEVAKNMALEVKKMFQSDYAIATTGNAGPTQNDSNASIGTVFIAIATPEKIDTHEFNFGKPREKVIERTVNKALELIFKEISKKV